jgi:hypothetical protein
MELVVFALAEPDDLALELTGVLEAFEDCCFPVAVVDADAGELPVAPNPTVPPPPRSEVRPPTTEERSSLFSFAGVRFLKSSAISAIQEAFVMARHSASIERNRI